MNELIYQTPHYTNLDPLTGFDIFLYLKENLVAKFQAGQIHHNFFILERGIWLTEFTVADQFKIIIKTADNYYFELEEVSILPFKVNSIYKRNLILKLEGYYKNLIKVNNENIYT